MKKCKVYIAAGVFHPAELEYNTKVANKLKECGFEPLLPQDYKGNTEELYDSCISGVEEADVMVAILNGADVDSGTSFECGYARRAGKYVIGLRNDIRDNHVDGLNLMIRYGVCRLVSTVEDVIEEIDLYLENCEVIN